MSDRPESREERIAREMAKTNPEAAERYLEGLSRRRYIERQASKTSSDRLDDDGAA